MRSALSLRGFSIQFLYNLLSFLVFEWGYLKKVVIMTLPHSASSFVWDPTKWTTLRAKV